MRNKIIMEVDKLDQAILRQMVCDYLPDLGNIDNCELKVVIVEKEKDNDAK